MERTSTSPSLAVGVCDGILVFFFNSLGRMFLMILFRLQRLRRDGMVCG